jgi:CRP-like cAMP-binding protein
VVAIAPGAWSPGTLKSGSRLTGAFAGLVTSGLLGRQCRLVGRTTTQLIGPGDVIPLNGGPDGVPATERRCFAAADTRVAVLDEQFLAAVQHWPWLAARIVERAVNWADRALSVQAMSQLSRVDARIVAMLWDLADRWGRVAPGGVIIPMRLTHAAIGTLVGAQRPTVSLALKSLDDLGTVRRHGKAWVLRPDSRRLLESATS